MTKSPLFLAGLALLIVVAALIWRARSPGEQPPRAPNEPSESQEQPAPMTAIEVPEIQSVMTTTQGLVAIAGRGVYFVAPDGTVTRRGSLSGDLTPQTIIASPDGSFLALRILDSQTARLAWHTYDVASGQVIATLADGARQLTWSPDGQRLLYEYTLGPDRQNLSAANADGNDWKALREIPESAEFLTWLPNETFALLVGADERQTLTQIGLSSLSRTELTHSVTALAIAPSGTAIAVVSEDRTGRRRQLPVISLASVDAGNGVGAFSTQIQDTVAPSLAWSEDGQSLYILEGLADDRRLLRVSVATGIRTLVKTGKEDPNLNDLSQLLVGTDTQVLAQQGTTIVAIPTGDAQ